MGVKCRAGGPGSTVNGSRPSARPRRSRGSSTNVAGRAGVRALDAASAFPVPGERAGIPRGIARRSSAPLRAGRATGRTAGRADGYHTCTVSIKLVASDLDGTLLRPDRSISDRTRRALRPVQAAGIVVVLVTGRPPRLLRALAADAGVSGLAICCNGAIVYDIATGRIAGHTPLEPARAMRLIVALREALPGVSFWLEMETSYGCEPEYAAMGPLPEDTDRLLGDAVALSERGVTKLIARHPDIPVEVLLDRIRGIAGDGASVTTSGAPFVEVSAAGVDKAWALATLARDLGIAQEEVVAYGDMPNDVPMLRWAGLGIAVANAHPEVIAVADEITLSNEHDGVAVSLERLVPRSVGAPRTGDSSAR